MRVALSYPGCHRRGGIERVVLESTNYLAGRGHEVHLYAADWDRDALDARVSVHAVPLPARGILPRLLSYARRAARLLAAARPPADVHGSFGVESPLGGVMWVPSVHKAWLEASRTQRGWRGRLRQKANLSHPLLLSLERAQFTDHRYGRLLALTPQVKADLMRFYDVPAGDIAVLPNGYSPTEFSVARAAPLRAAVRRALGYGDEDRVVIFVANELERKGFGPLLRAVASLGDARLRLLAVGRLDAARYGAEIGRLGLTGRVHFAGPSGDVATFYAAADLFALPTQYEAWGLVIVEALACGLPVVTSRLAGASVAVQEGRTGHLLDDPNDVAEIAAKLRPLLDGRPACAEEIEDSVRHYAWPNVLSLYERHLVECAASPGSRVAGLSIEFAERARPHP